jgi:antitoxin (DNA-binding transcriptional repressor) of toxin-antitoxin stability system
MKTVAIVEAKDTLDALLDLVEKGEEVTITRGGRAVARLVTPVVRPGSPEALEAVQRIKEMSRGKTLGGIPLKELIEDGRR